MKFCRLLQNFGLLGLLTWFVLVNYVNLMYSDICLLEGLSMSEEDDRLTTDQSELTRIINDLDIDRKLISASQRGDTEQVKELLASGAQVIPDEVNTPIPTPSVS